MMRMVSTTAPNAGERMVCPICGANCGGKNVTDETVVRRFRTMSFGPDAESSSCAIIAMVCHEHEDVPLQDVRRAIYNIISQYREYETSPIKLEARR